MSCDEWSADACHAELRRCCSQALQAERAEHSYFVLAMLLNVALSMVRSVHVISGDHNTVLKARAGVVVEILMAELFYLGFVGPSPWLRLSHSPVSQRTLPTRYF